METIVHYAGEFYYAQPSQDAAYHLTLFSFPGMVVAHTNIHVDDDRLSINAAKLGIFNHNSKVWEAVRTPTRRYRYGTPPEYVGVLDTKGTHVTTGGSAVINEGFRDMLYGRYPSVTEALRTIRQSGGKSQVAVSRFFYLMEDGLGLTRLMFRNESVLWMDPMSNIHFVEKTSINNYLSRCSKTLGNIVQELRDHAVRS
jgi:hypothetical protein